MENTTKKALAYYAAMEQKDIATLQQHLHDDVLLISPLAQVPGKQAVVKAAEKFTHIFDALTIRASFGSEDQAMVAFDLECPDPIGTFRAATLFSFKDNLIARIELFYDARPFEQKKEAIFSQK